MINQKKIHITILILVIGMQFVFGTDKLAQTGFQYLSVVPDARSAALANAMTTVYQNSSAMWGNPAAMAGFQQTFDLVLSQNNWIADIKQNALTAAFSPSDGVYGVFGVSMLFVDYGNVEGTIFAENALGYIETGIINPTASLFGLAYAKKLSNKFNVGGQVKYVQQYLGPALTSVSGEENVSTQKENNLGTLAYDFGTTFETGYKSIIFGMSVRNFSQEVKYVNESFQLPLTFSIGASINMMEFFGLNAKNHGLLMSIDAIHPRSHAEQVKLGLEYSFERFFYLRSGFISDADEQNFSYGFGLNGFGLGFDYAYTPFGVFENVQRFTIGYTF